MCKEGWLVRLGQEGCVRVEGLSEMPGKGAEQKRREKKQDFKKGGKLGEGLGALKRRRGWNPLMNYVLVRLYSVNPRLLYVKKITFYKCESYKTMTGKEKMKFVKRHNLCFNCLKEDYKAGKCPSKNRCLHPECAETHHTFLHDYFKKSVEETAVEDAKVCMLKLPQVQNIYLQIVPIKVRATNGKYISAYALLDTGSESTLIRDDFSKRLNLRKSSKTVNISSIKDSGELINVDEVKLYVIDEENTSSFHINKVLASKRKRFNMSAQFLPLNFQQNGEWAHLQGLKLSNINPSDVWK